NSLMDRCASAVCREQRCVDIDGAQFWRFQQLARQNLPKSCCDNQICIQIEHVLKLFRIFQFFWLVHRQSETHRLFFHRCRRHHFFSSDRPVRLCHDRNDFIAFFDEHPQNWRRKGRCSHKYNFGQTCSSSSSCWRIISSNSSCVTYLVILLVNRT